MDVLAIDIAQVPGSGALKSSVLIMSPMVVIVMIMCVNRDDNARL